MPIYISEKNYLDTGFVLLHNNFQSQFEIPAFSADVEMLVNSVKCKHCVKFLEN